jgi:hypothetical protein
MMSTPTQTIIVQTEIDYRWWDVLDDEKINFLVLDPIHDRLLINQLQTSPDWISDFASKDAVIFMRRERPPTFCLVRVLLNETVR